MRKKACICKEGWTGPHCKQRTYGDDDARGPIRLPVYALHVPVSLTAIVTLLAGVLTAGVLYIVRRRQEEALAGGSRDGGYQAMR